MATITKKDLIERTAVETGQQRAIVKRTVQAFLDLIIRELGDGNRLEIRDFGVFEIHARRPRIGRNPKTKESITVPARKTVRFKIGRLMKEVVRDDHDGVATDKRAKPELR